MIGIPVGLFYANAFEWAFHKYVLHGLGKNKKSFWAFHFHDHHREARRNNMRDPGYEKSVFQWNPQGKEALALFAGSLIVTPLFPVAPFFVTTVWASELRYYFVHRKSHLDTEWAKEKVPWHYAHHMGKNQDLNWCVTSPFFDKLMGTYELMPSQQPAPKAAVPSAA